MKKKSKMQLDSVALLESCAQTHTLHIHCRCPDWHVGCYSSCQLRKCYPAPCNQSPLSSSDVPWHIYRFIMSTFVCVLLSVSLSSWLLNSPVLCDFFQVLGYADYAFTSIFTVEILLKVPIQRCFIFVHLIYIYSVYFEIYTDERTAA